MNNGPAISRALVEAACKLPGVRERLPQEWREVVYGCPKRHMVWPHYGDVRGIPCGHCVKFYQRDEIITEHGAYIGPDLTLASELHNALRLAECISQVQIAYEPTFAAEARYTARVDKRYRESPDSYSAAVIAALSAALGVEG